MASLRATTGLVASVVVAGNLALAAFVLLPIGTEAVPPPTTSRAETIELPALPPPGKIEEPNPVTEEQGKVKRATQLGTNYLKERLLGSDPLYCDLDVRNEANIGAVALAGFTLLECGIPPDDPAVEKALRIVRAESHQLTYTYSLAAIVLFLDRRGDPADEDRLRNVVLQLIASQKALGSWGYHSALLTPARRDELLDKLTANTYVSGSFGDPKAAAHADSSLTQFATLALWRARRHNIPTDVPLRAVESYFRGSQQEDGGWGYTPGSKYFRDSMTCAGLLGLAVGMGIDGRKDPGRDAALEKGLRYLDRIVGRPAQLPEAEKARRLQFGLDSYALRKRWLEAAPADRPRIYEEWARLKKKDDLKGALFAAEGWGDLYFLWSLERIAMVFDFRTINGKDWYAWGSAILLAGQQPDGSWRDRFPGVADTCFALLFLQRVNVAKDLSEILGHR